MRARYVSIIAAIALFTAACGTSESSESQTMGESDDTTSTNEGLTPLSIGLTPISAVAPIYLGEEMGTFEEHGLDLDIRLGIGGPSAVAAVESGDVDIAIADPDGMVQTNAQGLSFQAIASAGSVGPDGVGGSQVVVAADSDIETVADLDGETIGVFNLQGSNELNVRAAIDAEGGDSSAVSFVNLEFSAMLAALDRGDVAAAGIAEPILSQAIDNGTVEVVLDYYPIVFPDGANITLWFTGDDQYESQSDALERFRTALQEAAQYADENPEDVRQILPEYSGISAEEAAAVPLQIYNEPLSEDVFERTVEIMQEYGTLDESYTLNIDDLLMP